MSLRYAFLQQNAKRLLVPTTAIAGTALLVAAAAESEPVFAKDASSSSDKQTQQVDLGKVREAESEPVSAEDASSAYIKQAQQVDLGSVRRAIWAQVENDMEKRNDGTSLAGTFIRLAWHCAGSYSSFDNSGGSGGARMRFNPEKDWGGNAGLNVARDALEPIKAMFPELSYGDLYTYAGVVAVEESGGPEVPFRVGRVDDDDGSNSPPKDDRLPDADAGGLHATAQHLRDVFYRMGFNDQEIVALSGAHAMGRCHTDRSGYWGPWTNAENTFSNEYFRLLLEERWAPKMTHNARPWTGPDQYEDKTGGLMMLPSDMVLVRDPVFKKYVELYAKNERKFFVDFAKAFSKLLELGVPFPPVSAQPWYKFW